MIVVADASPLNYLIQINCDGLLRDLYGSVLVPASVIEELSHPSAPNVVAGWLLNLPSWIDVRSVAFCEDTSLQNLDRGEREAIQLAEEQRAGLLLIDERLGRSESQASRDRHDRYVRYIARRWNTSSCRSGAGLSTTS